MEKHFALWKVTETTGCIMEDESDTRSTKVAFHIIRADEEDDWGETIANDCGYQDYSYQVDHELVAEFWYEEIEELKRTLAEYKPDF